MHCSWRINDTVALKKFAITCLSADYTAERHAFPRYNLRKVLTFQELYPERHAFPQYNPWKVLTFRGESAESQTSCTNISANSRKNNKLLLDVHQGPIRCCLMKKKRDQKISCYNPFKEVFYRSISLCHHISLVTDVFNSPCYIDNFFSNSRMKTACLRNCTQLLPSVHSLKNGKRCFRFSTGPESL
jgi:hypothetical protein